MGRGGAGVTMASGVGSQSVAGMQTYAAAPQTYAAAPQTYAAAPQTYAAAPQTYAAASQRGDLFSQLDANKDG
ncbi:unnamed protein product, partial [Effrenium voratum]